MKICLSYYVTCHMKIYQSKIYDFFAFLCIMLVFLAPIPTPTHSSGYHACFSSLIPILSHFSGYHACFPPLIPTLTHFSGYHACFSPPIPILSHFSWYHACFSSLIPTPTHFSGYHACFFSPIPTPTHFSGYHACFFASPTHYVYLVKNYLRPQNSPSKKLGLLFQLFGIFSNMLNFQTSQLLISYSYP